MNDGGKRANDIRMRYFLSRRPLIMYGAGGGGLVCAVHIVYTGTRIDAICDNDKQKWGRSMLGVPIMSPEEALSLYPDADVHISALGQNAAEIRAHLLDMGVAPERIVVENAMSYFIWQTQRSFSVDRFADLFALGDRLADAQSRDLFRRLYRNWLLGDRQENRGTRAMPQLPLSVVEHSYDPLPEAGAILYSDAETACDALAYWREEAGRRETAVCFSNADGERFAYIAFMLLYHQPGSRFYLREGSECSSFRLFVLHRDVDHEL